MRLGRPLYRVVTCSLYGEPVRTSADFAVAVDHGPEVVRTADTVLIPPFGSPDRAMPADVPDRVGRLLSGMKRGSRLVSLCGAAYLLAVVGRLDGRSATTHWVLTEDFRREFPRVALNADVLFVDDDDVLAAAGAAAGIDLCLHVMRRDHGANVANRVARFCVVPPHRDGGQRQYIEHSVPAFVETSTEPAGTWALENLGERLSLTALARHADMSVRTFTRCFCDETGMSPNRWLLEQRIHRARRLLERTELPVDVITSDSGLGTAAGMRRTSSASSACPLGVPTYLRRGSGELNDAQSHDQVQRTMDAFSTASHVCLPKRDGSLCRSLSAQAPTPELPWSTRRPRPGTRRVAARVASQRAAPSRLPRADW